MSEIIDIRYILNSDEVTVASDKIDRAIGSTQEAYEDLTANIQIQKQVIKELLIEHKKAEKAISKVAPGAVRQGMEDELRSLRQEIELEKKAFAELESSQKQFKESMHTLRSQILAVREEMGRLRLEGKHNSDQYRELEQRLGVLGTAYREVTVQQKALSTGGTQWDGVISGVQGLAGAYATASGILGLFTSDTEKLAAIQKNMQSVMAALMGMQQLANTLHSTSAFRITTVRKITELWTLAQAKLTVAFWGSAVAAKTFMAVVTLGLSVAITAVIVALSKWSDSQAEVAKEQEELRAKTRQYYQEIGKNAGQQLSLLARLTESWSRVGSSMAAQKKWIAENKEEARQLGIELNTINDANNAFVNNSDVVVAAIIAQAMAKKKQSDVDAMAEQAAAAKVRLSNFKPTVKREWYTKRVDTESLAVTSMGEKGITLGTGYNIIVDQKAYDKAVAGERKMLEMQVLGYEQLIGNAVKEIAQIQADAQKKLKDAGLPLVPQEGSKRDNSGDALAKAARERQWAIEQARIDAMNEGSAKQLAQIDLNHQREVARLKEQQAEAIKMAASIGDKTAAPQIKAEFATLEQASADKAMRERLEVTKQMQEGIIAELQKEVDATLLLYGQELDAKWAYLEQYGTIEQQRYAITMQYGQKIAEAKSEWQKKQLEQERADAVKAVDLKALQQSAPFAVLFDNLDTSGTATINQAITTARTLLDAAKASGKYTADELKVLYDALGKAETEVRKRNPFAALGQAVEAWDKKDPKKSFSTLASAAGESLGLVGSSLGIVVGGLKEMGLAGDEQTQKILDDSVKLIGGFGDIAAGLASMNPTQILQGAMAAITALWSLFDEKGRQADRVIKESQEKIDALKEQYQVLDDAIAKAYSQGASQLIEDQNVLLEQQKQLIKNQIAAEQSRKDGGDAGKVKEWQEAIKDIDKTVAQNKEKAVDAIFGSDVQSAINNFASAYVDAYGAGEDRAASQKEVVKKMIQGMVTELIKSNIADKVAGLRTALKNAILDGVISDTEQAAIDKIQEEIYAQSEKDAKSYDKWLKGDDDQTPNENSFTGAIRGSVATEASVAELGGIFRGQYDKLASIDGKMTMGMAAMMELARTNAAIELNTRATAANTAQTVTALADGFKELKGELTAIKTNTSKDTGSYGG